MKNYYNGKTAVVTGAGSGIGQAIACQLARVGCSLALIDISAKGMEETVAQIDTTRVKVTRHVANLSLQEQIHRTVSEIFEQHRNISLLFNIAGIAAGGTFAEVSEETIEKMTKINYLSQAYLIKAFLPHFQQQKDTHIVNMSSLTGIAAFENQSIYGASKHAVRGLSHTLYYELEGTGVHVSCIYPGAVSTNIVKNAIPSHGASEKRSYQGIENGMDSTGAADIILHGVAKNKLDIVVGKDAKTVLALQKLFPIRYWKIIKGYVHI